MKQLHDFIDLTPGDFGLFAVRIAPHKYQIYADIDFDDIDARLDGDPVDVGSWNMLPEFGDQDTFVQSVELEFCGDVRAAILAATHAAIRRIDPDGEIADEPGDGIVCQRADGTLWHLDNEEADQSDHADWTIATTGRWWAVPLAEQDIGE